MPTVAIKPFFRIQEIIGKPLLEMDVAEGITVNELLMQLVEVYGPELERELSDFKKGRIRPPYTIWINGKMSTQFPEGLDTPLKDKDIISIMIVLAGG